MQIFLWVQKTLSLGNSKMSFEILIEAVLRVWQMPLIYQDIHAANQVLKINETN